MPPLRTSEGIVNTFKEKVEALSKRFYPPSPANLQDIADTTFVSSTFARTQIEIDQQVTPAQALAAISRQKLGKALGNDQITTEFLKAMKRPLVEAIALLTNSC